MARPLRIDMPDGIYHVTSRGLERRRIVRDDADRERWLVLLDRVATRRGWIVYAWALLDNHFHLFVRCPHGDLSAGMHDLNSGYAIGFNRRHRRWGPLFQGRFKGIIVEREYHYWELTRYIHLNPVRAGLAGDPEEYGWSSCRLFFNSRRAPAWLGWEEVLRPHGTTLRSARRAYRQFLGEALADPPSSPLEPVAASTVLGSESFVSRVREWLADRVPDREIPADRQLRQPTTPEQVEGAVCEALAVPLDTLQAKGRQGNDARQAAIYLCRELTLTSARALGVRFGGVTAQAISKTARQVAYRRQKERRLDRQLAKIEAKLHKELQVET